MTGVDLASKFPRSQSDQASVGSARTTEAPPRIKLGSEPLRHGYRTSRIVLWCLAQGRWRWILWILCIVRWGFHGSDLFWIHIEQHSQSCWIIQRIKKCFLTRPIRPTVRDYLYHLSQQLPDLKEDYYCLQTAVIDCNNSFVKCLEC